MTIDELRAQWAPAYERLYKFIQDEAVWRNKVFPVGHPRREEKIAAANQALQDLIVLKDCAKVELAHDLQDSQAANAAGVQQLILLDVPAPYRA